MGEARQVNLERAPSLALVVLVLVIAGAVGYAFVSASAGPSPTSSVTPPSLVVSNLMLLIPQNQTGCTSGTPLCQSEAVLTATVSVHARTPLSCLDVYVNGSVEGSECWDLTALSFTQTQCNGNGSQSSCTTIVSDNTYTETARTVPLSQEIINGSNGPVILVGKSYQISIVGVFQDGRNSTVSATATAAITDKFSVYSASASSAAAGAP